MYPDRDLNELNQKGYYVDPDHNNKVTYVAKKDRELTKNEENTIVIGTKNNRKSYKFLASANVAQNGYQGFAVVPVTAEYPDGDINVVTIVSAGTTPPAPFGVGSDVATDFITAISGFNTVVQCKRLKQSFS